MSSAQWRMIQEVFLAVRDLPPSARDAYIASACPDDEHVCAAVTRMLAADEREGVLDRAPPPLLLGDAPDDAVTQARVGPYLIMGEIGRGGMGVVYRAYDPRLRREVALKFLPVAWAEDGEAKARFVNEARAASALDHPYNCPVYDIGFADDGRLYIAMAYCAGGSLAARLATGPLPVAQAVRVATQVAAALDRAHEAGIVHRDIKPANIAFTEHGDPRVLDFGVAVLGTDEWAVPRIPAGTPAYMAPEQIRGEAVDRRTDVWALGVVLFEMLAGARPFTGTRDEAARAILRGAPNDLRSLRPDVPAALAAAVTRALAKDPGARYASAAEFSAAIVAALESGTTAASRAPRRTIRSVRRRVALATTALALVGIASMLWRSGRLTLTEAPVDRQAVAVLPFRVRGDPSIDYLRDGMVDLLAAKLTGEGGLRAADPRGVYASWRRTVASESEDLARDSAVALARRIGAGNVLLGDVVGTPANLVVNAAIVNGRGTVVGRASVEGAHTELSSLVDRLTAQLLAAHAGVAPERLDALTTTSLPALRVYLEGQAAYRRGRYTDALERFGQAIDLDSTFALAGVGLALADGWVGTGHARTRGRAVAWRWRERLSQRDRALLTALVGPAFPRASTGRERLTATEAALRLSPDHVELWYEAGDLHLHFGRIFGIASWEAQAERALRRAVQADSSFAAPMHHLVTLYARQGRHDELRAMVNATQSVALEGATADYIRWRAAVALGAPGLDTTALDSMATETIGWIGMISQDDGVDQRLGEYALRLRHARPSTREERFERHLSIHAVALNAGRPQDAATLAESIRDVQPDSAFHLRLRILSALYGDGDRATADRAVSALGTMTATGPAARLNACIAEQWRLANGLAAPAATGAAGSGPDTPDQSMAERLCAATLAAMRAAGRRDPAARRAIARLQDLLGSGITDVYIGDGHLDYANIALARVLESMGDAPGALVAVRRRPYFIGWQPFLAASLRYEGQLAAATGDRAGAVRAYEHHLALRHVPEPVLRAATDSVRTELAALTSSR